jgi:hypothetical protein
MYGIRANRFLHAVKQYAEGIHRRRRIPDQRPEKGERLCQCS